MLGCLKIGPVRQDITLLKTQPFSTKFINPLKSLGKHSVLIIIVLGFASLFLLKPGILRSQSLTVGDPIENYLRLFDPKNDSDVLPSLSVGYFSAEHYKDRLDLTSDHPWDSRLFFRANENQFQVSNRQNLRGAIKFYSPISKITYNNNYPIGQNDGALWQGRGVNSMLSTGAYLSIGPLKASIRPNFIYSANREFELSRWPSPEGISEYGYELSLIDYPQRFGDQPISEINPGQSWIRGDYREFSAGISTSTMKLGPVIYNPIILSENAPGFLHFFIGTNRPVKTRVGNIEGKIFWGSLKESDYFDEDESNNDRFINGLILSYSPEFVKGLNVGISRIFVKPTSGSGLSFGDYFLALGHMKKGDDQEINRLQMVSLFSRWKIPNYGFEFYGEWARNTPANNFRDLFIQPEYSRAYTLGFLKRFILNPNHWLTLNYEMTQIERPRSVEFRPSEPFYRSNAVPQGYTHQGQMLGAGIGPGSNSQKVHLKYYWNYGMFGASFNRIVHDNTRLYENYMVIGERSWGIRNPRITNEIEFRYGINALFFIHQNYELQFDLYRSRFYHHEHGVLPEENPDVYNTNLQFTLRYRLDDLLR